MCWTVSGRCCMFFISKNTTPLHTIPRKTAACQRSLLVCLCHSKSLHSLRHNICSTFPSKWTNKQQQNEKTETNTSAAKHFVAVFFILCCKFRFHIFFLQRKINLHKEGTEKKGAAFDDSYARVQFVVHAIIILLCTYFFSLCDWFQGVCTMHQYQHCKRLSLSLLVFRSHVESKHNFAIALCKH